MQEDFDLSRVVMTGEEREFSEDIFKKVFKTKSMGGILAVRGAFDIGKATVDIAALEADNKLKSNTLVYVNAVSFGLYLHAVASGQGRVLYPQGRGSETDESFTYYGGSQVSGKPVSRLLKITHWKVGTGESASYDENAFVWKTGHFEATVGSTGAFVPNMTKPLSVDFIKVSRLEMAEISYRYQLALNSFAAQDADYLKKLQGKRK